MRVTGGTEDLIAPSSAKRMPNTAVKNTRNSEWQDALGHVCKNPVPGDEVAPCPPAISMLGGGRERVRRCWCLCSYGIKGRRATVPGPFLGGIRSFRNITWVLSGGSLAGSNKID